MKLQKWIETNVDEQRVAIVNNIIKDKQEYLKTSSVDGLCAQVEDLRNGLFFRLILPHETTIGISESDIFEAYKKSPEPPISIEEMQPCFKYKLNHPFLISESVISVKVATQVKGLRLFENSLENLNFPYFFSRSESDLFLSSSKYDYPTEYQLESAIRATSTGIFPVGLDVDNEVSLSKWMTFDLLESKKMRNDFGLFGLFFGEWCKDKFKYSHDSNAVSDNNSYVIKGGGAYFWPWQDEEWVWCMSAMRMPSSDLIDGRAALRAVIKLE